jgi:hypothetical protein
MSRDKGVSPETSLEKGRRLRKKNLLCVAFILIMVTQFVYIFGVSSQPVSIGKTVQPIPFESNPTANVNTGLTLANSVINAYDGNLTTNVNFLYGVDGSLELNTFNTTGVQFSNIGWVDFKISYRAMSSVDDQYRIIYYVGTDGPIILQDWVSGLGATFAKQSQTDQTGAQAHRTWINQSRPGGASWTWTDISNVRIVFETDLVNTIDPGKRIYVYEAWLTIYPDPLTLPSKSFSVQPQFIEGLGADKTFFVDVWVSNVTDMLNYAFTLRYDTSVLTAIEYIPFHPFNTKFPSIINDTGGYVRLAYMTFGGDPVGFTGATPIARIYFDVDTDGASVLDLQDIQVSDVGGHPIFVTARDGVFATSPVHDIAVTEVEAEPTQVMPGSSVSINVTVSNQGTFPETSSVTTYYNSTVIGSPQPVDLALGETETLQFTWDTTGVSYGHYLIKATASPVTDESDTSDNTLTDGLVIVGRHDMAVTNVIRAYPTQDVVIPESEVLKVEKGEIVYINVTLFNNGTFTQTFNVTALYTGSSHETTGGQYIIETKTDVSLDPGASMNLTFAWNTNTVVYQDERWFKLRLRGSVTQVPYEKGTDYDYTSNNLFIDHEVNVTRPPIEASFRILEDEDSRLQGQPISFDAENSYAAPGTELVSFEWDFGDGVKSAYFKDVNLTAPHRWTHIYSQTGPFNATLKVTNNQTTPRSSTETQSLIVKSIDVAIVEITKSTTELKRGGLVNINVTVANQGDFWEDANVSAYYGTTLLETVTVQNLKNKTSTVLEFSWNTTGVTPGTYTIKANATLLAGQDAKEYEKSDNELVDGEVTVTYTRDVAVKSVKASPAEVFVGDSVSINVTVENQGDWGSVTFTLTVYSDDTQIGTQTVTNLAAGTSTSASFTWATTGVSPKTYQIKATATLTGDNDLSDNSLVGDSVVVKEQSNNMLLYVVGGAVAAIAVVGVLVYFLKVRKPKTP